MDAVRDGDRWFLRLDKDVDLFSTLEEWAAKEGLKSGHMSGIGALKDVELGFYHLADKHYDRKTFPNEAELLSLDGNLSFVDGKPFFHIHTVLGDEKFQAYGGHLFSAKVAVTCEINFRPFEADIVRTPNEEIGLNLLSFCKAGH
jgi:predicted DNA-binding protein with PD1-like motif